MLKNESQAVLSKHLHIVEQEGCRHEVCQFKRIGGAFVLQPLCSCIEESNAEVVFICLDSNLKNFSWRERLR